jgi:hypothetical protein
MAGVYVIERRLRDGRKDRAVPSPVMKLLIGRRALEVDVG